MATLIKTLPLTWWLCLLLFLVHQIVEKIVGWHFAFFDNYLDPFLSIPILLGIHLAERRIIFREGPNYVLPIIEIFILSIFAALIFEEGLPRWFDGFVRDGRDYISYGFGVLLFVFFINLPKQQNKDQFRIGFDRSAKKM